MLVTDRLNQLKMAVSAAERVRYLASGPVIMLGASKGQGIPLIREAIEAGMTNFGENRVQEAMEKWPELKKAYPFVRLHLIGPLQTNKAEQAVELFDVIQVVDRGKLADALLEAMRKTGKMPEYYIQVNTGHEPQKAGVMPAAADELISYCQNKGMKLDGLMCVPPSEQPPAPHFALLRKMAHHHGLTGLSMGMSDDFETAIKMGSSCVRLGRALFGDLT